MLGNFMYCNPTRIYFGEDALDNLGTELEKYGNKILLTYGGGSIKKNGIYDKVTEILKANAEKRFSRTAGRHAESDVEKLYEGCRMGTEGNEWT